MSRPRTQSGTEWDLVGIARDVAIKEGFAVDFSGDELASLPEKPLDAGTPDIVDDSKLLWSSVDNHESRDLDQIEVAERLGDGTIRIKIAIADVDAFVPRGSPLDLHAAKTTTSLYAGIATFPMLPDEISSGRTSLLPGEVRYAVVTEMDVSPDGAVAKSRIYRAVVVNRAKLVYDDVGGWLEGHAGPPDDFHRFPGLEEQVRLQDEAAQRLRKRRIDRGALQLETIEARAVAKDGAVVDLAVVAKNRGRELVEDFMIAANGATAQWLESIRFASIRRIVRTPKRWEKIVSLAKELGHDLPNEPDAIALSHFMEARRAADPKHHADLSLKVVKLMGAGEYAVADPDCPEGHFGLAVDDYAHSTAPNRRYGDLVTQRLLKAAARGDQSPYSVKELWDVARKCTEREDHARKFERTMRKVAAALFLSTRIGETFDAICTGVNDKGTFVRLISPPAEGRVVERERGMDVGDAVKVRLVATEPTRGFIDFVRV